MLRYIDSKKMGRSQLGWLDSHFHFSFAEYRNPDNVQFGVLRVINDDLIKANTGFDTHPHRDMEILTYVVDGELTHADSMDNQRTLGRGEVQYMSAGTGVLHSEHNRGNELLRLLQIWIFPDRAGYTPNYGDHRFALADRNDVWLPIASGVDNKDSTAPIRIHADINMYASILSPGTKQAFPVPQGRQAYMVLIEGDAQVEDIALSERDALEIVEQDLQLETKDGAHVLLIEMAKSN